MIIDIEHFGSERRIDGPFKIKLSQESAQILLEHLQHALSDWSDDWLEISDTQSIPLDQRPDINKIPTPKPSPSPTSSPAFTPDSQYFVYGNRHKPLDSMSISEIVQYVKDMERQTSRLHLF